MTADTIKDLAKKVHSRYLKDPEADVVEYFQEAIRLGKTIVLKDVEDLIDKFCDEHYEKTGIQGWNRKWDYQMKYGYCERLKQKLKALKEGTNG